MDKITLPAGIGDGLWIMQTLDPSQKYEIQIADTSEEKRAGQLYKLLPDMVKSISFVKGNWQKVCTHELNTTFEKGVNIEDLGKPINWNLPFKIPQKTGEYIKKFLPKKKGSNKKYVGIYTSSFKTSKALGGWGLDEWLEFMKLLKSFKPNIEFVLIGAAYDDIAFRIAEKHPLAKNALGYDLGLTIEILKRLDLLVGFQSGIGCLSTYFDKNTIMLFSAKFPKLHNAFTRKSSIGKTWKGCTFCEPLRLVDWISVNKFLT